MAGIAVVSLMLALIVLWWVGPWLQCPTIRVSESGIYYLPDHPMYRQVTNVEACFATVEEARAAGFRAPLPSP